MLKNLRETLNLTKNEAKVYQALLQGVSIDPSELASSTKLPRSRIYEVLSSLAAKKLVVKQAHGSGYRLISPQESIPSYLNTMDREYQQKRKMIGELGNYLEGVWQDSLVSDINPGVEIFQIEDIEPQFLQHIKMVKNRVWIAAGSENPTIDMRKSGESLASIYHSKLDVRYLVPKENLVEKLQDAFDHFTPFKSLNIPIKFNRELFASFVILDKIIYIFFFGNSETLEATAMRTGSKQLVNTFEWVFQHLWNAN